MHSKRPFGEGDLRRIASEYREMPGLMLTVAQASSLWACDLERSRGALDSLVERGLLRRTEAGFSVLRSGSPTGARSRWRRPSVTFPSLPAPP